MLSVQPVALFDNSGGWSSVVINPLSFQYNGVCYKSLNDAANAEIHDDVYIYDAHTVFYPVSYTVGSKFGSDTVLVHYKTAFGQILSVPRIYPVCKPIDATLAIFDVQVVISFLLLALAFRSVRGLL